MVASIATAHPQVHAVAQIIFISLLITLQLGGCRVATVIVILLLIAQ